MKHKLQPRFTKTTSERPLNEFLGKTAAGVILNHIFPAGIKGETLTNEELTRFKRELRDLIGTQADLIITLIT